MHDPVSAFFQIQRDQATQQASAIAKENEEYRKLLDLAKGKDEAGKVVVKGQTTGGQQTKQPKATGKDLDAGMLAAVQSTG
jgi:hypothetical protein